MIQKTVSVLAVVILMASALTACNDDNSDEDCESAGRTSVSVMSLTDGKSGGSSGGRSGSRSGNGSKSKGKSGSSSGDSGSKGKRKSHDFDDDCDDD